MADAASRASARSEVGSGAARQRRGEPPLGLDQVDPSHPERHERRTEPEGAVGVAGEEGVECRAHVRGLAVEGLRVDRRLGERERPLGMSRGERRRLAGVLELSPRIEPNRLEQPVAAVGAAVVEADEGLLDEPAEHVRNLGQPRGGRPRRRPRRRRARSRRRTRRAGGRGRARRARAGHGSSGASPRASAASSEPGSTRPEAGGSGRRAGPRSPPGSAPRPDPRRARARAGARRAGSRFAPRRRRYRRSARTPGRRRRHARRRG